MQEDNCSFNWYSTETFKRDEMSVVRVNKFNAGMGATEHVLTRSFLDSDCMDAWATGFTKEQNTISIREFLANKPNIYRECFELSLNGFILTADTLKMLGSMKKFVINDVDRTEFFEKLSRHRISCILSLLSRWGVLWEFQNGKFANVIRGI